MASIEQYHLISRAKLDELKQQAMNSPMSVVLPVTRDDKGSKEDKEKVDNDEASALSSISKSANMGDVSTSKQGVMQGSSDRLLSPSLASLSSSLPSTSTSTVNGREGEIVSPNANEEDSIQFDAGKGEAGAGAGAGDGVTGKESSNIESEWSDILGGISSNVKPGKKGNFRNPSGSRHIHQKRVKVAHEWISF